MSDMTISDVADRLNKCAVLDCKACDYEYSKLGKRTYADCQALLIAEMGAECRRIAESSN